MECISTTLDQFIIHSTRAKEFGRTQVPSPATEWCAEAVQPGNLVVWASPLSGHRLAVSLLNRSPTAQTIRADWAALGLASGAKMAVRDVWQAKDVGKHSGSYSVEVGDFDVALLVLSSA